MCDMLWRELLFFFCPTIYPLEGDDAFGLSSFRTRTNAMAAYETTRTAPLGAITTYRFIQFISTIAATVSEWNDARVTRAALEKLSDRELDDIGLCRGDIDMIGASRF